MFFSSTLAILQFDPNRSPSITQNICIGKCKQSGCLSFVYSITKPSQLPIIKTCLVIGLLTCFFFCVCVLLDVPNHSAVGNSQFVSYKQKLQLSINKHISTDQITANWFAKWLCPKTGHPKFQWILTMPFRRYLMFRNIQIILFVLKDPFYLSMILPQISLVQYPHDPNPSYSNHIGNNQNILKSQVLKSQVFMRNSPINRY